MEHTAIQQGEIHSPYQWIVTDAAARAALVPESTDADKLCLQRSDKRVYRLVTVSPVTWEVDHKHDAADITNLPQGFDGDYNSLDNKPTLGTAAPLNVAASGDAAASEVVKGNDTRLTDARTPTAHGHTTADITGNYDATRLVGLVPIESIPPAALERLVIVANQAARYALTTASIQTGDTVKETDTGLMYRVKDDIQLGNAAGYEQYTAGQASAVPWGGVSGKPTALQGGGTTGQYVAGDMTLQTLGTAAPLNVSTSGNAAAGEVVKGSDTRLSDARTPTAHSHATADVTGLQVALDAKAPLANPSFTGGVGTPNINGAAASGFRNKIINGGMRISKKGNGAAVLGANYYGADGIITVVGGWSAISGAAVTRDTLIANDSRFTTGAVHYFSMAGATGASGHIAFQTRIEAADVQELGGKVVTAAARLQAWATTPSNYYFRIYKANAVNDFSAQTLVSQSASFGSLAVNTTATPSHTFTIPAGDCLTGLQVELVVEFTGAVAASTFVFLGDFQFCEGSKAMPFELRPIAIEEQLRSRYYRKQAVWIGTSTARTCFPINMVKTPTLSGGGTGFTSTGTDKDTFVAYQTTAALQTIVWDSEL